ncbi:hypothetical protein MPSEU_000155400 [Mayamaea pseudoterrestris]|nr:hypothetical protein MPSEU_000155400 [Mayamaea pseudoterrestris]
MKFASSVVIALTFASTSQAFAPQRASFVAQQTQQSIVTPAAQPLYNSKDIYDDDVDEEVEELVQKELAKNARMSNLRNANGVEYAPWMRLSEEDEKRIRATVREKTAQRKLRREQEQTVQGSLLRDSQGQELSGVGLRSRVIDDESVELEWATSSEASTRGFIVKRRAAKTEDFQVLASYESYGPLQSQGVEGGVYRYLDEGVGAGGWVYRVTECESNGAENDLSQCLVNIETKEEQQGALITLAAFGAVAVAAVIAGITLDPVQY